MPIPSCPLSWAGAPIKSSRPASSSCTQHSTLLFEVAKHLGRLAELLECPEIVLFEAFERLPIEACQPSVYADWEVRAIALIGGRDERDVPLLALVLAYHYPLWSDDRDFEGINEIQLFTTADLLSRLAGQRNE
jgi:hypothetical protein